LAPWPETSRLLLHISHDLRTSIRAIRVHSELLIKEWDAGQTANFAQRLGAILADTGRLESLADGVSGYSIACQVDPGSFVLVSLDIILRASLARLARELTEHGAVVTHDPLPRIRCEPDRIGQVFENLLRNTLHHRQAAPPSVHISSQDQGDRCLIGVRDNGPGIEAAYLERIFKPFERLRGHQATGPGLGLAICRAIVERHGGRIWAESQPGSGSSLWFTLPSESRADP
jgi:signal transduction histidine kinase